MATEKKKYVIEGEAYWFTPYKKDQYLEDHYTIQVCNLTKSTINALEKLGLDVKDAKDLENEKRHEQGMYVKWKTQYPLKVIDAEKNPWNPEVAIGNKSKVRVVFSVYDWKFKAKSGKGANPTTVQVIDLVEYNVNNDEEVLDEYAEPPFEPDTKTKTKKAETVTDLNDDLSDILPD